MATTKAHDLARLLADGVVGTTEIGDSQVTTAKIADASITTDKLATNAVTAAKVDIDAADVPYDNTTSGISANTLQEAIDYLNIATGGGSAGAQATYTRDAFTATAGQTTFTTSNGYTLGYVQVFMNGVMLALTDYTANDESTVVLSTGARAGDEIVVIAYDSFAISEVLRTLNISASFPDDGITLDAGGNVHIGKSTDNIAVVGATLRDDGQISATRDGGRVLNLNRLTSDGEVLAFRQDSSVIGVAGIAPSVTQGSSEKAFYIGSGSTSGTKNVGLRFDPDTNEIHPCQDDGADRDGQISLGNASNRFKDLHLSGGISLNGTDFINEYEEGSFQVTLADPSISISSRFGFYVRVGDVVHVHFGFTIANNSGSNSFTINGLPFGASTNKNLYDFGRDSLPCVFCDANYGTAAEGIVCNFTSINTQVTVKDTRGNDNFVYSDFSGRLFFSGSYFVN